jgi:hypothetical protein
MDFSCQHRLRLAAEERHNATLGFLPKPLLRPHMSIRRKLDRKGLLETGLQSDRNAAAIVGARFEKEGSIVFLEYAWEESYRHAIFLSGSIVFTLSPFAPRKKRYFRGAKGDSYCFAGP